LALVSVGNLAVKRRWVGNGLPTFCQPLHWSFSRETGHRQGKNRCPCRENAAIVTGVRPGRPSRPATRRGDGRKGGWPFCGCFCSAKISAPQGAGRASWSSPRRRRCRWLGRRWACRGRMAWRAGAPRPVPAQTVAVAAVPCRMQGDGTMRGPEDGRRSVRQVSFMFGRFPLGCFEGS